LRVLVQYEVERDYHDFLGRSRGGR
jgi:hypothetical protein